MGLGTRALTALATRALPGAGAGIGNTKPQPAGRGGVKGATGNVTWASPGQPQAPTWNGRSAVDQGYFGSMWVMRCCRAIADTIAGLPFRAGPSMDHPSRFDTNAPLAKLLGPSTGQGDWSGPNPTTSARAFWAWSIVQYLVTGRFAWEMQTDPQTKAVNGLWPLVGAYLDPVPSADGSQRYFDGFVYHLPTGDITLPHDKVLYVWRPSARDWRQPESVLEAARLPISVQVAIDRYMWSLLKNNMTASKMIVSPPFEEADQRRAWQEAFVQEFTGFDNAGKIVFGEFDDDTGYGAPSGSGGGKTFAPVQVVDLAETATDAQLIALGEQAKTDITVALGVPMSLIGNASQRTFSNADSEYRNFWTITVAPLLSELQDPINVQLAPKLGQEVGWFDVRRVVALQPSTSVQPPAVKDLQSLGMRPIDILRVLGVTELEQIGESLATAPIGEEATISGPVGTGSSAGTASANPAGRELRDILERIEALRERRQVVTEAGPSGLTQEIGGPYDPSGAGNLLPKGPVRPPKPREAKLIGHAFRGNDPKRCKICGRPAFDPSHRRRRPAAPQSADLRLLVPEWETVGAQVLAECRRATMDRLGGKRGRQMLRRDSFDLAHVYDEEHWRGRFASALSPLYAAAAVLGSAQGSPDAVAHRLAGDVALALGTELRAGVERGEELAELADRTEAVFAAAEPRIRSRLRAECVLAMTRRVA